MVIGNQGMRVWGKRGCEGKGVLEGYEFLFRYELKLRVYEKEVVR